MKIETIDRLITEDMISQGKCLDEIIQTVPPERRREFCKNIRPLIIQSIKGSRKTKTLMMFLFGRYKRSDGSDE